MATELKGMGHAVNESFIPLGDAKLIVIAEDAPTAWGFADDREGGLAAGVKKVPSEEEKAR